MKMTFTTKRIVVCQDKSHGAAGKEVAIGSKVRLYPDGQLYGLGDCHPSPWDAKAKPKAKAALKIIPKLAKDTPPRKETPAPKVTTPKAVTGKAKVIVQVGTKHTPKRGASRGTVQRATWTLEIDAARFKTRAAQVQEAKRQAGQFGTVIGKAKVF